MNTQQKTAHLLRDITTAPSVPSVSIRALGMAFADIDHAIAKHTDGHGTAEAVYDAIERAQTHMNRLSRLLDRATEQADHAADVDEERAEQKRRPEVIRGWFKVVPAIRIFGIGIGSKRGGIGQGVIDATKVRQAEPIDRAACLAAEANARAVERHDDETPLAILGPGGEFTTRIPASPLVDESGASAGAGGVA